MTELLELAARCEAIGRGLENAQSDYTCESVEQLENYHDRLVICVRDLNETLLAFIRASQGQSATQGEESND